MNTQLATRNFPTDINEVRLTGVVEYVDEVPTKIAVPMIEGRIRCRNQPVFFVAFNEVAQYADCEEGFRVEIRGKGYFTKYPTRGRVLSYNHLIVADSIRTLFCERPS